MGQNDTVLRIYNAKLIFRINQQLQKFQFDNNLQTYQFGTCYVQLLAEPTSCSQTQKHIPVLQHFTTHYITAKTRSP
ncbi:hypothetical protein Hanom_Chr05g00463971 [Helianthus anomalus]